MRHHAHIAAFQEALLLDTTPDVIGFDEAGFRPEHAWKAILTVDAGLADNTELRDRVLGRAKAAGARLLCTAVGRLEEVDGLAYDRAPRVCCAPWVFRRGDAWTTVALNGPHSSRFFFHPLTIEHLAGDPYPQHLAGMGHAGIEGMAQADSQDAFDFRRISHRRRLLKQPHGRSPRSLLLAVACSHCPPLSIETCVLRAEHVQWHLAYVADDARSHWTFATHSQTPDASAPRNNRPTLVRLILHEGTFQGGIDPWERVRVAAYLMPRLSGRYPFTSALLALAALAVPSAVAYRALASRRSLLAVAVAAAALLAAELHAIALLAYWSLPPVLLPNPRDALLMLEHETEHARTIAQVIAVSAVLGGVGLVALSHSAGVAEPHTSLLI